MAQASASQSLLGFQQLQAVVFIAARLMEFGYGRPVRPWPDRSDQQHDNQAEAIPARSMPALQRLYHHSVGRVRLLADTHFAGTVHFICKPAEENEGSRQEVVKDSLFTNP